MLCIKIRVKITPTPPAFLLPGGVDSSDSIRGELSYSAFCQPGPCPVLGGEMRQNEANLAITDDYSKRKMTWVIIAAEWMGFVHIHAVPSEVLCP